MCGAAPVWETGGNAASFSPPPGQKLWNVFEERHWDFSNHFYCLALMILIQQAHTVILHRLLFLWMYLCAGFLPNNMGFVRRYAFLPQHTFSLLTNDIPPFCQDCRLCVPLIHTNTTGILSCWQLPFATWQLWTCRLTLQSDAAEWCCRVIREQSRVVSGV